MILTVCSIKKDISTDKIDVETTGDGKEEEKSGLKGKGKAVWTVGCSGNVCSRGVPCVFWLCDGNPS